MAYFLHFYAPNSPKNQNWKKLKQTSGDIIILQMCTKNYDDMMHGSWNMVCDWGTDIGMDGQTEKVTYRGGCTT